MSELGFTNSAKSPVNTDSEVLAQKLKLTESALALALRRIYQLQGQQLTDLQLRFVMQEQLADLRDTQFGSSSERYKKPEKKDEPKAPAKPRVKKPSERYPSIPVREVLITQTPAPNCPCCSQVMTASGMTEDSEQLTVIPKKYEIELQKRMKYRCSCQGAVVTAAAPPRIIPGSSYSDEMIQDVVLSKYCDLIPIERYAAMAARGGLMDLPPQSLIELSHQYADFISLVYVRIRAAVLEARVLHADETPHRMLEGSQKKNWSLWGFSTPEHCFLECHDTRSGDVASGILQSSRAEVLLSDVYSGYSKAVRLANEARGLRGLPRIQNANCNAHARRYFVRAWKKGYKEAEFYLNHYHEIYGMEAGARGKPPPEIVLLRARMTERFEQMRRQSGGEAAQYPEKSNYAQALRYFTGNYAGLTLFLTDPAVAIDNNSQERLLRNHVVGRKTWYGTHSERGALTAAILFTVVESCKLVGVNPREYFADVTHDLLAGKPAYTPLEYKRAQAAVGAA